MLDGTHLIFKPNPHLVKKSQEVLRRGTIFIQNDTVNVLRGGHSSGTFLEAERAYYNAPSSTGIQKSVC